MKDPGRLVHHHPSVLARSLLTAAINEEPSETLLASTVASIAMGSAVVAIAQASRVVGGSTPPITVSTASAAASVSGAGVKGAVILATTVKWVGIASVGGVLALSGVRTFKRETGKPVAQPHLVQPRSSLRPSEPSSALVPVAAPVDLSSSTPADPVLPPAPTIPRVASSSAPTAQPLQLSDEANLIDQAREAVAAGDGPGALRILENHRRRFPQPRLQPEALYLRMQALRLEGHLEAAMRVAQHLLAEYPNGPQSAAARAVVNAEGR